MATPGLCPSGYIANQVAVLPWYLQKTRVTRLPHLGQGLSLACHGWSGRREAPQTRVQADTCHATVSTEAHVSLTH